MSPYNDVPASSPSDHLLQRPDGHSHAQAAEPSDLRRSITRKSLPGSRDGASTRESLLSASGQARTAQDAAHVVKRASSSAAGSDNDDDQDLKRTITYAPVPNTREDAYYVHDDPEPDGPTGHHGYCGHSPAEYRTLERVLLRKIDIRLSVIVGALYCLVSFDGGLLASASAIATTILPDLNLDVHNRYVISIYVYLALSIALQLPATILVRRWGPRKMFTATTLISGLLILCTALISTWYQMVVMRLLLGVFQSGLLAGLVYLVSTWCLRSELQVRFAIAQCVQLLVLGLGAFAAYGLVKLRDEPYGHWHQPSGWRTLFTFAGAFSILVGLLTYFWIPDFPERCHRSYRFLSPQLREVALHRLSIDSPDTEVLPLSWHAIFASFLDVKLYAFAILFFISSLTATALTIFLAFILQVDMGYSHDQLLLLAAPPYFYALAPVLASSILADRYQLRTLAIAFNTFSIVVGFSMLGFARPAVVRYIGAFIASGGTLSNWPAINAYMFSNIVGQWKKIVFSAMGVATAGLGGIAASYLFLNEEMPSYASTVWMILLLQMVLLCVLLGLVVVDTRRNAQAEQQELKKGGEEHRWRHSF